MITGANTNIRYRGILFHVQTEDSGRANPHIITHVYHGGTILGSHKTDYSDRLDTDDLVGLVRGLIDRQHQEMLERLKSGGFDDAIAARLGDTAAEAGIESKPDTEPDAPTPPPEKRVAERMAAEPPRIRSGAEERAFGEGIGSAKPLDEVILDYLAEKARDRGSDRSDSPERKTRSSG